MSRIWFQIVDTHGNVLLISEADIEVAFRGAIAHNDIDHELGDIDDPYRQAMALHRATCITLLNPEDYDL